MKIKKELRNMQPTQLGEKLTEMKKQLMKLNAQRSTGTSLENPGLVSKTKRTIALLLTIIKEKQDREAAK